MSMIIESSNKNSGLESASKDRVAVYTPESPLKEPVKLMREIIADVSHSRELIGILFMRDLKAQFRQTVLGYAWLLLPPLLTTGVWLFLNGQKVVSIADTGMPYAIFVIIGTTFWQSFSTAVQCPLKAFETGRPVFMKLKVPPEAFIAAGSARAVFDFGVSLTLLFPFFAVFGITPAWTIVFLPIPVAALYLLGTSIGLLLLPIGGLYGDVAKATQFALTFAMFLSPVIYPVPTTGWASTIVGLNPITPILDTARSWLVSGATGDVWYMLAWMPFTLITCVGAIVVLRVVMPHLIARMGM